MASRAFGVPTPATCWGGGRRCHSVCQRRVAFSAAWLWHFLRSPWPSASQGHARESERGLGLWRLALGVRTCCRAHPKGMLTYVSVAWGSAFGTRGRRRCSRSATFLGSKSPKKVPCIERSGCPAQLRVALEGPPHCKISSFQNSSKRNSGRKRPEISGNGRSLTPVRG